MIRRALLAAALAAAPLRAELAFSVVQGNGETPVTSQIQLASAAAGDVLDTLFRVRNAGNSTTALTLLAIGGSGFSLANLPTIPAPLLPGESVDFTVRFHPPAAGSFSALLKADGISVFVLAKAIAVLTVYLDENGFRRPIDPGSIVDFGAIERGTRTVRRFVLVNQTAQPLAAMVSTGGAAFPFPSSPVALDPQASTPLEVVFAPTQPGPQQGELRIDQRRFLLRGSTVEPPLPRPIVTIDFAGRPPASALQAMAAVRFDPRPRTSGTGTLRIEFRPSVAAEDDAAILFLPTASRTIDFSVIEGEASAQFGAAAAVPFQTGTTAGTLALTAELGDQLETTTVEIPPQPVIVDSVQMARTGSMIELQVSGYDNTRSISRISFTFLQTDGTVILPGAMDQDVTAMFKDYFAGSTLGGAFRMNAVFPVSGNAGLIDAVRLVLANAAGQTSWPSAP